MKKFLFLSLITSFLVSSVSFATKDSIKSTQNNDSGTKSSSTETIDRDEVIATYTGGKITVGNVEAYYQMMTSGNNFIQPQTNFDDLPVNVRNELGKAYAENLASSSEAKKRIKESPLSQQEENRIEAIKDSALITSVILKEAEKRFSSQLVDDEYNKFVKNYTESSYNITHVPFESSEELNKAYKEIDSKKTKTAKEEAYKTKHKNFFDKINKPKKSTKGIKGYELSYFVVSEANGRLNADLEKKLRDARDKKQEYVALNDNGIHSLVKLDLTWDPKKDVNDKFEQANKPIIEKQIKDKLLNEVRKEMIDAAELSFVIKTEKNNQATEPSVDATVPSTANNSQEEKDKSSDKSSEKESKDKNNSAEIKK